MAERKRGGARLAPETLGAMREAYEAGAMCWAIAAEFGGTEGAVKQTAARHGWKRPPGFADARRAADRWNPTVRQEAWLRENWHSSLTRWEIEAELGVCIETVRRAAVRFGLGAQRNVVRIVEGRNERAGVTDRERQAVRLLKHSDLERWEIANQLEISEAGLRNLIHRVRARDARSVPLQKRRMAFEADEEAAIRDGFRLGVGQQTLARLLWRPGREITVKRVWRWGSLLGLKHRNTTPRALRLLSPEQIWAYEQMTWDDPVDLVQKVYRMSRDLTARQAVQALADYHAALERFPRIPGLNIALRKTVPAEFRRAPHPDIEALRETYAHRH